MSGKNWLFGGLGILIGGGIAGMIHAHRERVRDEQRFHELAENQRRIYEAGQDELIRDQMDRIHANVEASLSRMAELNDLADRRAVGDNIVEFPRQCK